MDQHPLAEPGQWAAWSGLGSKLAQLVSASGLGVYSSILRGGTEQAAFMPSVEVALSSGLA